MRKLILCIMALAVTTLASAQQKQCYIYSQKVFESMPQYTTAVETIESLQKTERAKVDKMLAEVKAMYDEYMEYESRMTEAQVSRYRDMIIEKEEEANKYEESVFGDEGTLTKRQEALMKPIEEKVVAAVKAFAERNGYDMVFDFSLVKLTIFQSEKLDMTNKIIEELK